MRMPLVEPVKWNHGAMLGLHAEIRAYLVAAALSLRHCWSACLSGHLNFLERPRGEVIQAVSHSLGDLHFCVGEVDHSNHFARFCSICCVDAAAELGQRLGVELRAELINLLQISVFRWCRMNNVLCIPMCVASLVGHGPSSLTGCPSRLLIVS